MNVRWFLCVCFLSMEIVNGGLPALNVNQDNQRCPAKSSGQSNSRIRFSDLPTGDYYYKAYACSGQSVQLVCCMENYVKIDWYQRIRDSEKWVEALEVWWERSFLDDNQTLMIGSAQGRDKGHFRCVGQGATANETITAEFELAIDDCFDGKLHQAEIYTPSQYEITFLEREVGENETRVRCQVFFGKLRACGSECIVEWKRETKSGQWIPIGNNETERVYSEPPSLVYDAGFIETTLHIRQILQSDYEGQYVCVAETKGVGKQRTGKVQFQPSKRDSQSQKSPLINILFAIFGSLIILSMLMFMVAWSMRLKIKLMIKQSIRPALQREGLSYHVVLLSAPGNEFTDNCIWPSLKAKKGPCEALSVFRYPDDIMPGRYEIEEFGNVVQKTRCVVAVIDRQFLDDKLSLFYLDHAARMVDVVYVFHGLDPANGYDTKGLGDAVKANIVASGRWVVWPKDEPETETDNGDERSGRQPSAVDQFWLKLHLAIPNRRRSIHTVVNEDESTTPLQA